LNIISYIDKTSRYWCKRMVKALDMYVHLEMHGRKSRQKLRF